MQNEVYQEESEQNDVDGSKKAADSTGKVHILHRLKSILSMSIGQT